MGVFSELDLENQQTELDGHDSKTAEMQTLQAKLIQQHEQKKAAAAAEVTSKELVAELVAKTEAEQEDPAAAEAEKRRRHEEAETKRKAEWERQQAEKRTAEQAALAKIEQMSETELVKASMERRRSASAIPRSRGWSCTRARVWHIVCNSSTGKRGNICLRK